MRTITVQVWTLDPSFSVQSPGMVIRPDDWSASPQDDFVDMQGQGVDLSPYLLSAELTDGDESQIITSDESDSFTVGGTTYQIYAVYNGDSAVIAGATQKLVTFYGQSSAGESRAIALPVDEDGKVSAAYPGTMTATSWLWEPNEFALPFSSIPCFVSGTLLRTPEGDCRIDDLRAGSLVMTRDHGPQKVRWIGAVTLTEADLRRAPALRPVIIAAGALGPGVPSTELRLSAQHRVLLRSKIAARMFGAEEMLIAATRLIGQDGISVAAGTGPVTYLHLMFDQHELLFSNGAEAESLYLGTEAAKALPATALHEILDLFPGIRPGTSRPARPFLAGNKARMLVQRHRLNRKPLVEAARRPMQIPPGTRHGLTPAEQLQHRPDCHSTMPAR
ncbi:Hint domain-containing protein [Pseudomonas sp. GX19020]|uniref:Hint domain-containing protein n=1 Tax=Pseudomonas sp. GX19020 TaxID=2942277 RepID=UPI00201931F5|nr:Hint domain-containing protein [Pseudomonas sp. GX19020]MCL4065677.1 Hint domain-containing protein [Pseudomonas sp. GX19020]